MELEEVKRSYFIALQRFIYSRLMSSSQLSGGVNIYRKIPKGAKFPFVFLGKILVFDRSLKDLTRVHFLHEIALYSKDETLEEILLWGEEIKRALVGQNIFYKGFLITEVSFLQMELDVMSDGVTNKMIMKFKFNVEENNASSKRFANVA